MKKIFLTISMIAFVSFSLLFVAAQSVFAEVDVDAAKTCVKTNTTVDTLKACLATAGVEEDTLIDMGACVAKLNGIDTDGLLIKSKVQTCFDQAVGGLINIPVPKGALTNINTIIGGAIQLIMIVAGLIAFVYLLLGGIKWITSGGDKSAVETARNQIIQALIGIIVVLAAWGLIILVQQMADVCLGFGCTLSVPKF